MVAVETVCSEDDVSKLSFSTRNGDKINEAVNSLDAGTQVNQHSQKLMLYVNQQHPWEKYDRTPAPRQTSEQHKGKGNNCSSICHFSTNKEHKAKPKAKSTQTEPSKECSTLSPIRAKTGYESKRVATRNDDTASSMEKINNQQSFASVSITLNHRENEMEKVVSIVIVV